MIHTLATMHIPAAMYDLLRTMLIDAGYSHVINNKDDSLDMTGISLVSENPSFMPPSVTNCLMADDLARLADVTLAVFTAR